MKHAVLLLALALSLPAYADKVATPKTPAPKADNKKKAPAPPGNYDVGGIHAYLYYHSTGKFSDNDLATGQHALFNTVIGEGDAGAPSSAMLVVTDLTGPTFANVSGSLVVDVKQDKKRIAKQSFEVGQYFGETSKISLPLLVPIDCGEVSVTATLTMHSAKPATKTTTISFGCGE